MILIKQYSFLIVVFLFGFTNQILSQESDDNVSKLIKQTVSKKSINYPSQYSVTTYNKLIVTANPDLIKGTIDSIFVNKRDKKVFSKIDSTDYYFKKIVTKQHLYQTEKISKIEVLNHQIQEKILASKMAGFNEPLFEYFSLNLQPFSLYDDKFIIVEKEYTNPLSIKGLTRYQFDFLDIIAIENREVYKISFRPKNESKNNQLEGILYIDVEKLSIAKVELEVKGLFNVSSNLEFTYNAQLKNWFLLKSELSIKKGSSKDPLKIFGRTITFETNNPNARKDASDFIEINSKTFYLDPHFDEPNSIKNRDISIIITENAYKKRDSLWNNLFIDVVDKRSKPTYISLDSLIQKRKYEHKIKIGRKVLKGYYPVSFFDIDLRSLIRFNNYEGFRLGFGGITNEKLAKRFKMEGYFAYGIKDGFFKGMLANSFLMDQHSDSWIGFSYKDDINEIANDDYEINKSSFKLYDPRPFNISTFYNFVTWKGSLSTKIIPKTECVFQFSTSEIIPKFPYSYFNNGNYYTNFKTTLFTTSFNWNPKSKFMKTPKTLIEYEKNYPRFTFQFSKSIPNLFENSFNFGKIDLRFEYLKKFNSGHQIQFIYNGGYAFGSVPITHLYNHSPNSLDKLKIIQRINFASKDGFETMFFNEFISNKHASFLLKHQFPKFIISNKIKPIVSFVTKFGIGDLDNKNNHQNLNFKVLNKGFFESGVELNKIYKGVGFVTYYRHGPNKLPRFEDNIALKLSVILNLEF